MEVTNTYVLTGNGTMNVGTNIMMTNSGVISGAGSLTKSGTGTLLLSSSSNSYGGVTTISGGALQVADLTDAGIVSPIGTNGTIMLTNGGNFDYVGTSSGASMNRAFTLAGGDGGIGVSDSSVTVTLSGAISDMGNLVKRGAGTLRLSASNSYSGATTVSAGTLELASLTGSATGSASSVTVTNGATLLLSQSDQVNNDATVTLSGGTITRGSGVSEVFGSLNLAAASFLDFGTGAAGTITFGAYTSSSLLTINNFGLGNTLVFGNNLTDSINNTSLFQFSGGFTSAWNGSNTFTITAIPETSTYVAALGLLALCMLPLRRKRAR
jgi:fibronectin-binding autotransporter adhesin